MYGSTSTAVSAVVPRASSFLTHSVRPAATANARIRTRVSKRSRAASSTPSTCRLYSTTLRSASSFFFRPNSSRIRFRKAPVELESTAACSSMANAKPGETDPPAPPTPPQRPRRRLSPLLESAASNAPSSPRANA